MSWVVEVQHRTDHDLDGQWYELELCASEEAAERSKRWYARERKASYHGRPLRIREVDRPTIPMPTPNRPPRRWVHALRRAKRSIRA